MSEPPGSQMWTAGPFEMVERTISPGRLRPGKIVIDLSADSDSNDDDSRSTDGDSDEDDDIATNSPFATEEADATGRDSPSSDRSSNDTVTTSPRSTAPLSSAQRFIETPELRQQLFKLLDKPDLAKWTRVSKATTYDVAQELYKEVNLLVMRHRMSRTSPRRRVYCNAVRRIICTSSLETHLMVSRAKRTDFSKLGFPSTMPLQSQCAVLVIEAIRERCPRATQLVLREEGVTVHFGDDLCSGTITTYRHFRASLDSTVVSSSASDTGGPPDDDEDENDTDDDEAEMASEPGEQWGMRHDQDQVLEGFDGYEREYDTTQLKMGHLRYLACSQYIGMPGPVRSIDFDCYCINLEGILILPAFLPRCTHPELSYEPLPVEGEAWTFGKDVLHRLQVLSFNTPAMLSLHSISRTLETYSAAPLHTLHLPVDMVLADHFPSALDLFDLVDLFRTHAPNMKHLRVGLQWPSQSAHGPAYSNTEKLRSTITALRKRQLGSVRLQTLHVCFGGVFNDRTRCMDWAYACAAIMAENHTLKFESVPGPNEILRSRLADLEGSVSDFRKLLNRPLPLIEFSHTNMTDLGIFRRFDISLLRFTKQGEPLHACHVLIDRVLADPLFIKYAGGKKAEEVLRRERDRVITIPYLPSTPRNVYDSLNQCAGPGKQVGFRCGAQCGGEPDFWEGLSREQVRLLKEGSVKMLMDYLERRIQFGLGQWDW